MDQGSNPSESFLRLENMVKRYGELTVVDGVSLDAGRGEFVVFVGPSGCGKSTLLRMLAGLEEASGGEVWIDGQNVTNVHPARRGVAMVFQSYALYPHMSVRQNMGFGLKMAGVSAADVAKRVNEAARVLQIVPLLDRRPRALSGGQRQRVAIGRAIVRDPKLFLFDEPLSNLDAELRTQMRVEIARLHREIGATMVYVTHDQVEAMTLADRIVVLRGGRVEQIGTPQELYERPANLFVAGFIGSPRMNMLAAESDGAHVRHPALEQPLAVQGPAGPVTLGLRPEHLVLDGGAPNALVLQGEFAEHLGGTSQIYAQAPGGDTLTIGAPGRVLVQRGERLRAGFDPAHAYVFDSAGLRV